MTRNIKFKQYWLLPVFFTLAFFEGVLAQQECNIRLKFVNEVATNQLCYHIQLASANPVDFNLAGQNYRLYYDSENFRFNAEKSKSLLPESTYQPLVIKENLMEIDASGIGVLPFEKHLGFLNIGNDLNDIQNGGVKLPATGEWVNTTQICFNYIGNNTSTDFSKTELYWSRSDLTAAYATAYVEIAEWVAPNQTKAALINKYEDIDLSTSLEKVVWENTISIYPNPTAREVWIDLKGKKEITTLKIWDSSGKMLKETFIEPTHSSKNINLDDVPAGMYYFELSNGSKTFVEKIEKIN